MQVVQSWLLKNNSGTVFGTCKFLIRSSVLFGKLVTMFCQQWAISSIDRSLLRPIVLSASLSLKILFTHSGYARRWNVCGIPASGLPNQSFLLQRIFVIYSIVSYDSMMIFERKFLWLQLDFCEIGGMLFISVGQPNLWPTFSLWLDIYSRNFLQPRIPNHRVLASSLDSMVSPWSECLQIELWWSCF